MNFFKPKILKQNCLGVLLSDSRVFQLLSFRLIFYLIEKFDFDLFRENPLKVTGSNANTIVHLVNFEQKAKMLLISFKPIRVKNNPFFGIFPNLPQNVIRNINVISIKNCLYEPF